MSKYIKVHINNEVIYLNPEFIVGLEPYKDCETILHLSYPCATKLLQKREMRKDIVIELSYKGFSRASDYS